MTGMANSLFGLTDSGHMRRIRTRDGMLRYDVVSVDGVRQWGVDIAANADYDRDVVPALALLRASVEGEGYKWAEVRAPQPSKHAQDHGAEVVPLVYY